MKIQVRVGPSRIAGQGLFAAQGIPKGTRIIQYIGARIPKEESVERLAQGNTYIFAFNERYDIDGKTLKNKARYINHSCEPSCRSAGYDFELAVRDIQPGEELTDDYGSLNLEYDFRCACATAACRRTIHPDDLLTYAEQWDQIVAEPFRLMPTVAQPLWPLVKDKEILEAVLACRMTIASCRENYYPLRTLQPAQEKDGYTTHR